MPNTESSFQALGRLLRYASAHHGRIWLASFCSVMNKLFDIMPEILIGMAIDVVVRQEASFMANFGLADPFHQMLALGALTIGVWGFESLFEFLLLVLWRNLAQSLQHDLRLDAYEHLQQLDMSWFEDSSTGNLVAILNDDVNQLERFLNGGASDLIQVVVTVLSVGGVFFFLSPSIAMMAFTPIPLILVGAFWFQRRAQPLYANVRERVGLLSTRLANNIAGISTIKSFTREQHEVEQIRSDSEAYVEANRDAIRISSAFIPIIRMAIMAGFVATLVFGGKLVLDGQLNAGAYSVMVFLTQRLLWPLTRMAETVDLFERAMASTRRILNLIQTPVRTRTGDRPMAKDAVRGEVAFEGVSFAYASGPEVLTDIDLRVPAGKTLALVGQTGSGKSSLVKLLLRFYEPTRGEIRLDGVPLGEIVLRDLRGAIGLVSQDVYLFHGTITENIAYGRPGASDDAIVESAQAAEADQFIRELQEGYDTVVGERGQKLSGGQRQRVSIARAVLKDPPLLILDEATSAVDNETEAAIQRSMRQVSKGRTTFVIAHRLSTIVDADLICVLEKGRIIEQGRHHELLARGGLYQALWRVQTGLEGTGEQQEATGDAT
jgi:ATP-binding cassette subfamily B protein